MFNNAFGHYSINEISFKFFGTYENRKDLPESIVCFQNEDICLYTLIYDSKCRRELGLWFAYLWYLIKNNLLNDYQNHKLEFLKSIGRIDSPVQFNPESDSLVEDHLDENMALLNNFDPNYVC